MAFLHQTTTIACIEVKLPRCFLWHSYIKPQHVACVLSDYHRCFLWHSYIKPQLTAHDIGVVVGCFLWHSYIKPQPSARTDKPAKCCFLWHSYIKPQPHHGERPKRKVVSYGIPTSNHNVRLLTAVAFKLFLMAFLHQTTTGAVVYGLALSCFLWHSYIKPQRLLHAAINLRVVSYGIPTSNHNPLLVLPRERTVVSYGIPTSNHNRSPGWNPSMPLFLMAFLHQTTTVAVSVIPKSSLFLMAFLHQTTTY